MKKNISRATIDRLPLYYRMLKSFQEKGEQTISSEELSRPLKITPEQIRKDLTTFGNFGRKGVGYDIDELINKISQILGLQHHWHLAIIGVGHLGAALANYKNFSELGFKIVALIDTDERIIGSEINEVKIYDYKNLKSLVHRKQIDIGVITVPANSAQAVADSLVEANIRGIWNFAPVKLEVPENIPLINEDLSIGMCSLSYQLAKLEDSRSGYKIF